MKNNYGIVKNGAAIFLMGLCLAACGKAQEPEETVEVVEEVQEPEIETEEPEVKPVSEKRIKRSCGRSRYDLCESVF